MKNVIPKHLECISAKLRETGTIVQDAEKMAEIITHLAVNASQGKDLMEDVFSSFPGTESGIRNKVIIPYSFYDPQEEEPGGEPGAPDEEPGAPGADD